MGSIPTYSRQIKNNGDKMNKHLLRNLPKIDELLNNQLIADFLVILPRDVVTKTARKVVDEKRAAILENDNSYTEDSFDLDVIVEEVVADLRRLKTKSLRRVINGSGVVLHTNLGRANLNSAAVEAVADVATHYSTLEYDPREGRRGSRHDHVEKIIRETTGAEAAMVVNNNAAATMLCLAALGRGKEVIISRGELVEIGGSFRVPEIMEESGAKLVEVGTTNKTRLSDYENRINEETGALMKVHTSNYKIIGFTEDVSIRDLKKLGEKHNLPMIYDMGSGLMINLSPYGINEPTVKDALKEGADVILFSGDKLLGGPQGGIIAGKKSLIDKMKSHPLARVLRVDKMTLAAMEATFKAYYDEDKAKDEVPVLSMLTRSTEEMSEYAKKLKHLIECKQAGYSITIDRENGLVGGGSAPTSYIENIILQIQHKLLTAQEIAVMLRQGEVPIVTRIQEDKVIIDMRTLMEEDLPIIADRLEEILV